MKIALIYTGQLRTFRRCWPNHKECIHDANSEHKISSYFYTYENPDLELEERNELVPNSQWIQCHQAFYPDPFGHHLFNSNKVPESQACQVLNMMHNNLVGFSLVPHRHDVYVRIRPDEILNGNLKFSNFDIKPNTVFIPQGNDYRGVNDQFAFGDYESMKKWYSVYINAHQLFTMGTVFNAEIYHKANAELTGLDIVRFGSPQQELVR